jgi:hypothetical protein
VRNRTLDCWLRSARHRQLDPLPHIDQSIGEVIDQGIVMQGRWRDAQPLCASSYGRIVDGLNVDAVA